MQSPKRIILLAGEWETTAVVYHFLEKTTCVAGAVIEKPVARKEFLKKRVKKQGWLRVGGQVLFQLLIARPMSRFSKKRVQEILAAYQLEERKIPEEKVQRVSSVNSPDALTAIRQLQPDLIVVHGTRIISKKLLQEITCPFVNIHAGITPLYRGSHGAYWALVNNDREHCGVTLHLVDPGIDTGTILQQKNIPLTSSDNFITYPYLQLAEGLQLLKTSLPELLAGRPATTKNNLPSALWYHPTLWGYLYKRLTSGVK